MDALLQIEAVASSQNIRALRKLFDNIGCHVRSLKSLGVESESYEGLLCPVLVSKVPADLQLIVSRKVSEADWNFDTLMDAIEEEITARERVGTTQSRPPPRRGDHRTPPTAAVLVSGDTATDPRTPCCYCNQLHSPNECDVVTQVESRKQLLHWTGRCFSCLRRGYMSRECWSNRRCQNCRGCHHTSICEGLISSRPRDRRTSSSQSTSSGTMPTSLGITQSSATPSSSNAPTTTHSTLNPSAPEFTPPFTSTSLCASANRVILLQTALAEISNPRDPARVLKARIVMDSGSQKSYVTKRVKNRLSLPAITKQRLSIAAFGSSMGQAEQYDVICLNVRTKTGDTQELIPLAQLNLADISQDKMLEVDVLIGSDFYWKFATGEIIRGQSGPVAVGTILGWVLSGPAELAGQQRPTVSLMTMHTLCVEGVTNKELNCSLRAFWELESLGIQTPTVDPVCEQFASSVKLKGGRYKVSLPWLEHHDPLPDNYCLSRSRLRGLLQRLRQEPTILREYDAIIRDQIQKGIVEVVGDAEDAPRVTHYLHHHAVIRRDKKTTKTHLEKNLTSSR